MVNNQAVCRRYFRYWGKARQSPDSPGGDDYHLLPYHGLDVAACGYWLLKKNYFQANNIFSELELENEDVALWFAYFLAWHDIGKFARGFQRKYFNPDSPLVQNKGQADSARHDSLGFWLWENRQDIPAIFPFEEIFGIAEKALDIWLNIITGHHGKPPERDVKGKLAFHQDDYLAVKDYLHDLSSVFPEISSLPACFADKAWLSTLKQQSWALAGLTVLADWLGSRRQDFHYRSDPMSLSDYWQQHALPTAEKVVSRLPRTPAPAPFQHIRQLFPFIQQPTPLQQQALEADISVAGPQLFILEDVTGAGKTEAAMILAHRLMAQQKGGGIYVALPTMATANAMYQRLAAAYRALYQPEQNPSLILAHGARHMSHTFTQSLWDGESQGQTQYGKDENSASKDCNIWFADSRKKALLADVGVGTLDQALMAVMPFRHQSLRVLGLRHKILILDEIHAYDAYMSKLIEHLIGFHARQGGSAIVLTATLPLSLRERLTRAFAQGMACEAAWQPDPDARYPWFTQLNRQGLRESALDTRPAVKREVKIGWLTAREQGIALIKASIAAGQSICWIRNTVDDAIAVYRQLLAQGVAEDDILLFHSRFAFCDRMAIEERALSWFGKESTPAQRSGKVLIATQVVEQSLDIDVDNMISDLAPIDLLIQRAGRLQRHIRYLDGRRKNARDNAPLTDERPAAVLYVLAPEWQPEADADWLGAELRNSGYVYPDHAALWRTQAILRERGAIRMPEDARTLINGVYEEQIVVPAALEAIANKVLGERYGQRSIAGQLSLALVHGYCARSSESGWSDAVEISTRLGENTLDLYLARMAEKESDLPLPYAPPEEFAWEKSRLQVRESWWLKYKKSLPVLEGEALERFRQQLHRPAAQVLLLKAGESDAFYSKTVGLSIEDR
ncbi:CRISPR-associated helicase/endonuclease Cas3 [Brenneria nigrifluens DSM 30175 = ATCC 13028]|uniref:CRISPR-associated helicase/endonuclease Cas3 n=2 Tax=Pectobacteriaceae TaxID=1903410 RepID=A0A2U1UIQ2_9GAMM|nr:MULTISPECIES: CRISPR-associated helicase/endonuclease Cas3 [Brenneria]PWC21568.1 CRISPR-associated helicase/endonuclease Cas3 [Brenneria nigrifluens DSM 30175 = ATCC 13028]QCR06274.1 CRISPR-associated helicase/endonuclease Cas3 [Brenneria nigrifluens DSM 30175 = ATCC 13028]